MIGQTCRRVGAALALVVLPSAPRSVDSPSNEAATADRITAMQVSFVVIADGTVGVHETIDVDTGAESREGLVRVVPTVRRSPDGEFRSLKVIQPSATRDGAPIPVEQVRDGDSAVLVVGDANTSVAGKHQFVLSYSLDGAIDTDVDAGGRVATLPVNGQAMPPIDRLQASVAGPVTPIECISKSPCTSDTSGGAAVFIAESVPEGSEVKVRLAASAEEVAARPGVVAADPSPDAPVQAVPGANAGHSSDRGTSLALPLVVAAVVVAGFVTWLVRRRSSSSTT